ncbi:hypothetical protein LXL04_020880 [Taraxacum kok-saghyz]
MSEQIAEQTPLVYPISEINPPPHRQTDGGSFGGVFIVLAVIVVVSAVACFLGRFCNKRHNKSKPPKHGHSARGPKEKDMKHNTRNAFQTKDGDIEFGFDKRFSSAKVAANGDPMMGRPNNSFKEPSMGRPDSFREPSMGRSDPSMGRPNSFRKGEFRDDQMRFGGNQDHEMNFRSGPGPQHY